MGSRVWLWQTGPAGLRLIRSYEVDKKTGNIYSEGILDALEGGFFGIGREA